MQPLTTTLLALADQPYDNYNSNLLKIKELLGPEKAGRL